jgi:hypothetical protein
VVDTLAHGLTVGRTWPNMSRLQSTLRLTRTLGDLLFAVTAADANAVDDIALLCLVPKAASLVGAGGAGCTVDHVELAVLPAPARQELSEKYCRTRTRHTERGEESGGHPTVSSCTAHQCTCMRPSCG